MLLAVSLLMLITPLYNSIEPRLFGMPFFYWSQFLWVPIEEARQAKLASLVVKFGRCCSSWASTRSSPSTRSSSAA